MDIMNIFDMDDIDMDRLDEAKDFIDIGVDIGVDLGFAENGIVGAVVGGFVGGGIGCALDLIGEIFD